MLWLMFFIPLHSQTTRPQLNSRVNSNTVVIRENKVTDTTPVSIKIKRIYKPTSKYAQVITKVYTPIKVRPPYQEAHVPVSEAATEGDSIILVMAITKVMSTIRSNYTIDVHNYIDTIKDLKNIQRLRWKNNKVYRRDINGLSQNILLLDDILRKPKFDDEDIEMIDYVFTTNDSLISKMPFNNYAKVMSMGNGPVQLTILDHNNQPVQFATCYFVDKYTWRKIENNTKCPADPALLSCDGVIIPDLDAKAAFNKLLYSLPANNTRTLSYGVYHVLIIKDAVIAFHEIVPFDFDAGLTKTIILQNGQR